MGVLSLGNYLIRLSVCWLAVESPMLLHSQLFPMNVKEIERGETDCRASKQPADLFYLSISPWRGTDFLQFPFLSFLFPLSSSLSLISQSALNAAPPVGWG